MIMKKLLSFAVTCAIALMLAGCATLLGGGPNQKVTVKSDRPAVSFTITDETGTVVFEGKDPGVLTLARKHTYKVEVALDGYAKQTVTISQGVNGWFWGNFCLGIPVVGMGIDFLTGSMWDLQPSNLTIKMKTALAETTNGYVVTFYTRDDQGQLRSLDVAL